MASMSKPTSAAPTPILPMVCLLLTAGLLIAGLSPFNPFPRNAVSWLPGGGLEFGERGIAYSTAPVSPLASAGSGARENSPDSRWFCSLQVRIQPKVLFLDNSGTVLDFYSVENPLQFRLMQWRDELLIRRDYFDSNHKLKTAELELANAFLTDEPVNFTIVAGPAATIAYRNGQKAGASSRLGLSCADFAGQLLVGEAPIQDDPWHGKIFELALYYDHASNPGWPDQIATFNPPPGDGPAPGEATNAHPFARYAFGEGSGKNVHSRAASGPDLYIPGIFVLPHKQLLLPPWKELDDKLSKRDIAINIAGFMPFGFLVFAYLHRRRRWRRAAVWTVLAGFLISATIEILQAYIPSRTSGVLDIMNNTLGTGLGVWLFHWRPLQIFASKLRLYELPEEMPQK
jgi:hypothetical protein